MCSRPSSGKPAGARRCRTLDVRTLIARGESPYERIVAVTAELAAEEDLLLLTPFLPSPLIEKLQGDGFTARPERRSDGTWQTYFVRRS